MGSGEMSLRSEEPSGAAAATQEQQLTLEEDGSSKIAFYQSLPGSVVDLPEAAAPKVEIVVAEAK